MNADHFRRVQFVTRRFHELQGLRTIIFAVACIAAFWLQPYIRALRYAGPFEATAGLLASFMPFAAALTMPLVDRYYRRRCGSVAATAMDRVRDVGVPLLLIVGGLWIDLIRIGTQSPSAALIAGAVLALHVVVRDWPWRGHYVIAAVACAIGAWLTAVVPSMRADTVQVLARIPVSWLLATYAVTAYFDHRLLLIALPVRRESASLEAAAD